MAAAATATAGPRYAPEDPTLLKPWKGLVDGKTGYLYFWNPETNVTQYDRPTGAAPPPKASSAQYISSSVQVQPSSQGQRRDEGDDRYVRSSNGGSKFDVGPRNVQTARSAPVSTNNGPSGPVSAHGGSLTRGNGPSDTESGLFAEAYCRRHEITVIGENVPPPLITFEATGFPSEILREVRYLLPGGANVVRCAALLWGFAFYLERPFTVDQLL